MSTASTAAKLALKTQSGLMSGDMGIAPTVAAGQAHAAAAAQPAAAASTGAYDMHSMVIASQSFPARPASSSSAGRPVQPLAPIFQQRGRGRAGAGAGGRGRGQLDNKMSNIVIDHL